MQNATPTSDGFTVTVEYSKRPHKTKFGSDDAFIHISETLPAVVAAFSTRALLWEKGNHKMEKSIYFCGFSGAS